MIEQASNASNAIPETKKVLRMVKNERMGGSVPVWETVRINEQDRTEQRLTQALKTQSPERAFETTLAYTGEQAPAPEVESDDSFGFGDLVDMVNPLHHVPVVNYAYRSMTGDEIKPIGQIIGGAVFGGALGAAAGIVNTIIEEETGKDMTGNAVAMLVDGDMPNFKRPGNNPEETLAEAQRIANNPQDLPAALLAFTPPAYETGFRIERSPAAQGRTAGFFGQKVDLEMYAKAEPVREPITQVSLKPMPGRNSLY